jgi:hypothetical protein
MGKGKSEARPRAPRYRRRSRHPCPRPPTLRRLQATEAAPAEPADVRPSRASKPAVSGAVCRGPPVTQLVDRFGGCRRNPTAGATQAAEPHLPGAAPRAPEQRPLRPAGQLESGGFPPGTAHRAWPEATAGPWPAQRRPSERRRSLRRGRPPPPGWSSTADRRCCLRTDPRALADRADPGPRRPGERKDSARSRMGRCLPGSEGASRRLGCSAAWAA